MRTTGTSHCAKFSDALLPQIADMLSKALPMGSMILDPFAGTGKGVDFLCEHNYDAWGVELEPEFIESPYVIEGNALSLPFGDEEFDGIVTSPTYGNRMADKDMRESVAGTYAKSLGRHASEGSSCHLQWGDKYREFHRAAWIEATRVLRDGGYFILNVKNHIRAKEEQLVSEWHCLVLASLGYELIETRFIETPGVRIGANSEARVDGEYLHLFRKEKP